MSQIVQQIAAGIATGLASIVVALMIAIQRKVLAKLHLQVGAVQEARERAAAEQAVLHAEEWAAKQASDHGGMEKFAKAKAILVARCPWLSLPMVESLIEATVAKLAVGAAAEITRAADGASQKIAPK